MFLVSDSSTSREGRIQQFLAEDPAIAALLSVVHFEWTLRRAIIALGRSPNVDVRAKLGRCHGLQKYKECWKDEVHPGTAAHLAEVVKDWKNLNKAFNLRHRLVHGATSCGPEYAEKRVAWAIAAAQDIRAFCAEHSVDLDQHLPIRQRPRQTLQAA